VTICKGTREGRNISVVITIRYGLDGPGIETRRGRDFSHPSRTGLGAHPATYTMGTVSNRGSSGRGVVLTIHPQSSAEVKEIVELNLYSLSGNSWPVLGRTLPCTLPSTVVSVSRTDSEYCLIKVMLSRQDL